jgi:membrane-bound inhibitor of C-type lysozyme
MPSLTRTKSIIIAVAAVAIAGGSYAIVSATSGSGPSTASSGPSSASSGPSSASTGVAGRFGSGGGSNARSGPEPGGTTGTVSSTSTSGFTVTTAGDVKVTVKQTSATSYENGTSPASASAVTTGKPVLVLGTTDNTTITATQVIVQPPAGNSSTASEVIFYQKGSSGSTKAVGQIPADYVQGHGTIVSGTDADQAAEAALTAYPGGIIDRVVKLGNGDYEVHNIGVNWPHHVFVNQDFKVIGAND